MILFSATLEILSIWVIYIMQKANAHRKLDPKPQCSPILESSYTNFLPFCYDRRL